MSTRGTAALRAAPLTMRPTARIRSSVCPTLAAILLFALISSPATFAQAQDAAETAAFNSAARAFNLGIFERARNEFAQFVRRFPASAELPKAVLFEAQAALKLGDAKTAASLLKTNLAQAGIFAEEYEYWLGEVYLQATNYLEAAAAFGQLVRDFPGSQRVLDAAYYQAFARSNLKDWAGVIDLLQAPDGPFQKQTGAGANSDLILGGSLLLAQAFMETQQPQQAEKALTNPVPADANADLQWRREFLLCRIHLAEDQLPAALAGSSNLVKLATAAGGPARRAESVIVQAGILEQLNNLPAAAAVYEQNLRNDVPAERRRESLQKIIDITLKQNALDEAAAKLERLLVEHPREQGSDVARLTLGRLRLTQYLAQSNSTATATNQTAAATNLLQLALAQFDRLLNLVPPGRLAPKAQLYRGWCLWELRKIPESAAAFQAAAEQLPHSEDQAVARFKLGDAHLMIKDYTNALQNFQLLLNEYRDLPEVSKSLFPQAWYNILRCSLELNDLPEATRAMATIVRSYPESPFADKSMLLVGQQLSASWPAEARTLFIQFKKQFPESALLPEVELAVARSYQQEQRPEAALERYDQWVIDHPTNSLRARAEFDRAVANYEAGREKNALLLFTNFLARFGTSELAPLAQNWVADFFFRQADFVKAEENYQLLYQNTNWATSDLSYQARMMAGRSAFARQAYRDATNYFVPLINDTTCPPNLLAEAYFALGDTMVAWGHAETAPTAPTRRDSEPVRNAFTNFQDAKEAFEKIPAVYPTNDLVPRAWGRVGDCYLQMAAFDAKYYESAIEAYQKVIAHPTADVCARSLGEIGIGDVLEKQARSGAITDPEPLLKSAFDHYYNVFSTNNLRPGEKIDLPCFKTAALAGARLAEERKQWELAVNIYKQLIGVVPSIRTAVERKIEHVEQLRAEKS